MNIEKFMEMVKGFQASSIILTAIELNIFEQISDSGMELNEIATLNKFSLRATEILLNALVAMGLLVKQRNRYFLSEFSQKFLRMDSPDYLGFLKHEVILWHNWEKLPEVIRKGKSVRELSGKPKHPENIVSFIQSMHSRGIPESKMVLERIQIEKSKKMLDVGCGSGIFGITAKKLNPALKVTFLDIPEVISLTKKYCLKADIIKDIEFIEGDFLNVDWGGPYDLILLSSILHIYGKETNINILKKCILALESGGRVIIRDFFLNPDKTSPLQPAIFAVNMLVNTEEGRTYSEEEILEMFQEVGLQFEKRILIDSGADIIIGKKV